MVMFVDPTVYDTSTLLVIHRLEYLSGSRLSRFHGVHETAFPNRTEFSLSHHSLASPNQTESSFVFASKSPSSDEPSGTARLTHILAEQTR